MLVSFQDNLTFKTRNSYILNYSRSSFRTPQAPQVVNKAWRGVNFTPRFHQTRLSSPKFTFRGNTCTKNKEKDVTRYNTQKTETPAKDVMRLSKENFLPPVQKTEKEFERKFRPLKPQDDAIPRAQTWRSIMMVGPYTNPKPFDHRGLDDTLDETRLRTLKTPDPYNIRFKRKGRSDEYKTGYTDPLEKYSTRDIDFKFDTSKTTEPHYDSSLLFSKGRYSPAFSAYNAYLDRVNKTVSLD